MKARVIAFYLPQFHPIPENDEHWGKGFTEWTNVGKAKPLFKGHYQPRVPADLGYYDLRIPEVRVEQANLAREAGIEGFMYWHYWFGNGKRVLEKPFNEVLASGEPDFPFCLGWANHSWSTRTWTNSNQGKTNNMIFEQLYPGIDDYILHFNTVLPAFKDKRYLCVDGKPLFVIYSPKDVPDIESFIALWNKMAIENGLEGIHFVGVHHRNLDQIDRNYDVGFDAVNTRGLQDAEIRLNGRYKTALFNRIRKYFGGIFLDKHDHKKILKHYFTKYDRQENVYPTIVPQWDRSARSGRKAVIYHGSTPDLFKKHVQDAIDVVSNKTDDHKIIFLKSWNEWAEGNYMEPDLKFGKGYLNALREALEEE